MGLKSEIKNAVRLALRAVKPPVFIGQELRGKSGLLTGRTILVSGGTSGIGRAIAVACLGAGASVVITSRSAARAESVASELSIACEGRISGAALSLSGGVTPMLSQLDAIYRDNPELDAFISNAGVFTGEQFGKTAEEDFDAVIETNLKGAYFLSQEVARRMVRGGVRGNILFVTSSSAYRPATNAYACSKWALRGLVEGESKMLAPYGIVVNAVAPGPTATPMLIGSCAEEDTDLSRPESPIGRFITPEEIAEVAVNLLCDSSRAIIGDAVRVTGGSAIVTFDDTESVFRL